MKKIIYAAFAFLFALGACQKGDDSKSATAATDSATQAVTDSVKPVDSAATVTPDTLAETQSEAKPTPATADNAAQARQLLNDAIASFNRCKSANDVYKTLADWMKKSPQLDQLMATLGGKEADQVQALSTKLGDTISKVTAKYHCDPDRLSKIFQGQ